MDTSQAALMAGSSFIIPGQAAYVKLPADVIRNYVDSKFPALANCPDADFIKGYGHRWAGGHDLLVDVPRTFAEHGPLRGIQQVGHTLLTDLPTKAGIPIPGLSGSSDLGHWLVEAGIPKGYLSVHWADGALGFLAISEGSTDIIQAIHGSLVMNTATFFDTFGEGAVEIYFALNNAMTLAAFNPAFLIVGGVENVLAGVISGVTTIYDSVSIYIEPLVFFGSAGTSALIGFALSYGLVGQSLSDATSNSMRSGVVGAFFSLSPAFGFGALAGLVSYKLGCKLGQIHNDSMSTVLKINNQTYQLLLDEMSRGNVDLLGFLECADSPIVLSENPTTLQTSPSVLNDEHQGLPDKCTQLNSDGTVLTEETEQITTNIRTLPDDSPILSDWYRQVFN